MPVIPLTLSPVTGMVCVLCQSPPSCFEFRNAISVASVEERAFQRRSRPPPASRFVSVPREASTGPVSWLEPRNRTWRLVFAANDGMVPLSWLLLSASSERRMLVSKCGIVPLSWLPERDRVSRAVLVAKDGIVPLSWLLSRARSQRVVLAANDGMVPLSWL